MTRLLDEVLADLGLAGAGLRLTGDPRPAELASPLAVAECAIASVAACLTAATELSLARTGRRPGIELDTAHVAAAVRSEALLRDPGGRAVGGFAPLSRLWPAADGWVRTHANYPWHRAALLAALGEPLAEAIAARPALEVERVVYAAGGLAVAARTPAEWQWAGPSPLVAMAPLGGGARPLPEPGWLREPDSVRGPGSLRGSSTRRAAPAWPDLPRGLDLPGGPGALRGPFASGVGGQGA